MSDGPRHYTVAEAEALLPRVRELLAGLRRELGRLTALRGASGVAPSGPVWAAGDRLVAAPYFRALEAFALGQAELEARGIRVKDLERGLVDFPTRHQGRTVLLCWQEGEERVGSFHEVEGGFASRRPVAELEPDPA